MGMSFTPAIDGSRRVVSKRGNGCAMAGLRAICSSLGRSRSFPLLAALLLLMFFGGNVRAQEAGMVSGVVVSSWDGTPLSGVVVTVRGLTLAAQSDGTGKYLLKSVPPGEQVLRFSKSGYASAVVTDVRVLPGQSTTVNGNLRPEFYEMEQYEVTTEEFTGQSEQIMFERQQASGLVNSIGAEQFARLGVGDAADIIGKVSGSSIVDGKFAVIRGLSDRYTSATLNGAEIPSADPYRKSAQLDLFPSGQIDRVVVSKTFTPDQPGSFTGGNINIITKSFPEKPFLKLSIGTAYNTQSSLNDEFLVAPGTSTRAVSLGNTEAPLPEPLRDPNLFQPGGTFGDPTQVPRRRSPSNESPLSADTRRAQANQLQAYNQMLGPTAFQGEQATSPLDTDFNVETGITLTNKSGGRLGAFLAINYDRGFQSFQDGVADRYTADLRPKSTLTEDRSQITTQYGGSGNLAYGFDENNAVQFNTLMNQSFEDEARQYAGSDASGGADNPLVRYQLHHIERSIQAFQLAGSHTLPVLADNRIEWLLSKVATSQDEPNFRLLNANTNAGGYDLGGAGLPQPNYPSRFYRELEENNVTFRFDDTQPFEWLGGLSGFLKGGYYGSTSDRSAFERTFSYQDDTPALYSGSLNNYLTWSNLNYTATRVPNGNPAGIRTNYTFERYLTSAFGNNDSTGSLGINAGYFMGEIPFANWFRFIGGIRYETTLYEVQGKSRDSSTPTNSIIDQADWLPALGGVFTVARNMNIRLNYAKTIARPSFRELSPGNTYDPTIDVLFVGNPGLKISQIENYDIRWEWFYRPGQIVSLSAFAKQIDGPIELQFIDVNAEKVTYQNRDEASLYGVEFELSSGLDVISQQLDQFSIGANLAYIQSEVKLTPVELANKRRNFPDTEATRPLFDQSPYIINLNLSYNNAVLGTVVTVAANLTGERLFVTNPNGPDIYEHPPVSLDLIVSQRISKHLIARFKAKNLLDPAYTRTYGEDPGKYLYSSYKKGIEFGFSLSAEF